MVAVAVAAGVAAAPPAVAVAVLGLTRLHGQASAPPAALQALRPSMAPLPLLAQGASQAAPCPRVHRSVLAGSPALLCPLPLPQHQPHGMEGRQVVVA